ncbi:unnamed protein product [Ceutorhynchus assimilis]|uniref:DNA repair protein RAD50 n=1 Tax=Ceutorhynchus assimilis TaxID=467358 RepID=A0A9N9QRP7_9CUCU|nr:unnamed protein product [Ceutorhynchus assimilis]
MAVLERLCIRGIRSFSPNEEEKVKFTRPLTLILGQNGCGKTTLIECLKFALTNELPAGTDGGRGFLNDPKLSNKSTVKGYVKLQYRDANNSSITVAKFAEVTVMAGGKMRFKSMNPTIRWEDDKGNFEDISGRCADIDLYCAQKLNVSKAIINNVIFCHQENSAWPLEEPKKLKERFDEIFGSTEYNKCVDRLRKLVKEKRTTLKVLFETLKYKQLAKKNTEKLREALNEKELRLEDAVKNIDEKKKDIEPLEKRLNEINEVVDTLSSTHQKLTGLETTLKGILENQEALKKHMDEEYDGTDEQLNNDIENFSSFQEGAKKEILSKESKKDAIDKKVEQINQIIQERQVALGQLKQEEHQQRKREEELKGLIEKCKAKLKIETEEDESMEDIFYKLNAALVKRDSKFKDHQKLLQQEEQELQKNIDKIRDGFAAARESRSANEKLLKETSAKLQEAKLKLERLSFSDSQIEVIEKRMKETEEALAKKKAHFKEEEEMQHIEELDEQISKKDQTLSKLEREFRTLQQNYVTDQKIESETNVTHEKSGEIIMIKEKHRQDFQTLFGQAVPQEKFQQSVQKVQKTLEEEVKSLTKNITNSEKKVSTLESTVKHLNSKYQSQLNELKSDKAKIESVCKGRPFLDVLKESYKNKEIFQKDKGAYRSAKNLLEQFISSFQNETPCCPICSTDFSSQSQKPKVSSVILALRKRIEDLPSKITEVEANLKREEANYSKLLQLKPVQDNIQMLEDAKIPLLEEELQQTNEQLEETKIDLGSLVNDLIEPQNKVEICRKIMSDCVLLDRLSTELKRTEDSLKNLKRELVTVASNRTLHETETELSKVKAELSNLRRQYKTKRDFYDETKDSIQRLNGRLQTEIQKKLEVQKSLQEQPVFQKQVEDCTKIISKVKAEKLQLGETFAALEKELLEAEKNRSQKVEANKKSLDEDRSDVSASKRLVDDAEKLLGIIKKYENGDSVTRLENVSKELEECKNNIKRLEESKKILISFIEKKKAELASQESKFRNLNDNRDLRASRVKSKEIESQIQELRKKIGNHNSKSIIEERRKVIDRIDKVQTDISRKKGEMDTLKELIQTNKQELNKKEHREAAIEYRKTYYEYKVEEMAISDLEVYTGALEKSILKFHQERMVQINLTIRELWRNIYRGNDIDFIQIITDDDIGATGTKRRSYSYKVVQMKKGNELEMRGRCSAGQKVLACLVIRMALAETFSANCGILALDEPTTNLDRDNIMSLSDALSRIISVREKQKSFQLLIITHDEEFLQTLTRDQSVSRYFRVYRNADGFSQIKSEIL